VRRRPGKPQELAGARGRSQLSANPQIASTKTVIDIDKGTINST
jgi:hypothetical protein